MRTIAVFLALSAVAFGSQPAVTDTPTQPKTSTPQWHSPAVPQKASGGFWRVDHTFKSTIALKHRASGAGYGHAGALHGRWHALPACSHHA
jgi:hypothetical protein